MEATRTYTTSRQHNVREAYTNVWIGGERLVSSTEDEALSQMCDWIVRACQNPAFAEYGPGLERVCDLAAAGKGAQAADNWNCLVEDKGGPAIRIEHWRPGDSSPAIPAA